MAEFFLSFVLFTTSAIYPKAEPHKTLEACLVEAAKRNQIDPDVTSALGRQYRAEWVCLKVNRAGI